MANVTDIYYAGEAFIGYKAQLKIGQGNGSPETFVAAADISMIKPGAMTTGTVKKTHLRSPGRAHEYLATIATCEQRQSYGVDTTFWRAVPRERWSIARDHLVVGMKGLPGQPGLGIGHRPDRQWTADRDGSVLRQWIGADVALYAGLSSVAA